MAEFERAFSIHDRREFIAARAAKIVAVAHGSKGIWGEGRGDPYFVARQRAYFLNTYEECKCHPAHSCSGCEILIGVVALLEKQVEHLDQDRCEIEEAKVRAICTRLWQETQRFMQRIAENFRRMKAEREGRAADRRAHWTDNE